MLLFKVSKLSQFTPQGRYSGTRSEPLAPPLKA